MCHSIGIGTIQGGYTKLSLQLREKYVTIEEDQLLIILKGSYKTNLTIISMCRDTKYRFTIIIKED